MATLQWGRSTSLRKTFCGRRRNKALRWASMGPQHIAAENLLELRDSYFWGDTASMGPQHIAAENVD